MSKKSLIIGSNKGGVGKSLVAQLLVGACDIQFEELPDIHRDRSMHRVRLVEIDHAKRLSSEMPDRVDLSIVPTVSASGGRGHAVGSQFDQVYEIWAQGNAITDLGANVTTPFFDWMRTADVLTLAKEDKVAFEFVAVASTDEQALRSAVASVREAKETLGEDARYYLVLNDVGSTSGFAPYEGTEVWRELQALRDSANVETFSIPRCESRLLEYGKARRKTVFQIMDDEGGVRRQINAQLGLGRVEANREFVHLTDWLRAVDLAIHPLLRRFVIGHPASASVVDLEHRRAG